MLNTESKAFYYYSSCNNNDDDDNVSFADYLKIEANSNGIIFFLCSQVSVPEFQYARGTGASLMMVSHKALYPAPPRAVQLAFLLPRGLIPSCQSHSSFSFNVAHQTLENHSQPTSSDAFIFPTRNSFCNDRKNPRVTLESSFDGRRIHDDKFSANCNFCSSAS